MGNNVSEMYGTFCARHPSTHTDEMHMKKELIVSVVKNREKNIAEQVKLIKKENKQLKQMLNDLSQKLQEETSKNECLQNELTQMQTNSDICDEKLSEKMLPNIQQEQEEINQQTQAKMNINCDRLHEVYSYEKTICSNRVNETLTKAKTLPDHSDVKTFIMNKYKTIDINNDSDDVEDVDEHESDDDESSLDLNDKMEIEVAKRKTLEQEEIMHMQKELAHITQELPDLCRYGDKSNNKSNNRLILPDTKSNLFRSHSGANWNTDALIKKKKEMKAALAHLVVTHVNSNNKNEGD
eukprot:47945_1